MAFKVTPAHWEVLLNFMEAHPDFARGRISGPNAKDIMKKLWAACATNLNSVGGGARKVDKWQKVRNKLDNTFSLGGYTIFFSDMD